MIARARSEDGFTIIEVMVAAFCLALIVGVVGTLFVSGSNSSLSSQRQTQLIGVADQQIEQIRQAVKTNGFAALAMSAAPAAGTNAFLSYSPNTHTDPNDLVSTASGCATSTLGYKIEANYLDTSAGTVAAAPPGSGCIAGVEPLVVQTGPNPPAGIVTPSQASVPVGTGSATATVSSYVTETYVGCNASFGSGSCARDARRVIVAVKFNNSGGRSTIGPNSPVYVSTIFTNPIPSNQPNASIGITLGLGIG